MGILNNLFGKKSTDSEVRHQWLDTEEELNEVIERSKSVPVAIFKHSTRCNISSMAKSRIERSWDFETNEVEIYFLDLIMLRHISDKIATLFNVEHQSPQVILLKNGSAVYNTSHSDISVKGIRQALKS